MFCDVRGFSTLSENRSPEEIVGMLNEVFERLVAIVFRHGGTLDKFLGDGMMVLFGAPKADAYQEEHAIRAALEMQQALSELRKERDAAGRPLIRMGIGINSGVAVAGNIGSSQRMEYTAIGDTVNLASRLQTAAGERGENILISEYTYNAVRGAFHTRSVGFLSVKGRQDQVQAYAVDPPPATTA
jgi:adenylate cyclase